MELPIKDLAALVATEISKPDSIWDDFVPIDVTDTTIDIYLTDGIDNPSEYNKLCSVLRTAPKTSKVTFYLNTPGGSADSAFMIVDAMKACDAPIHGKLSGNVSSAGTIITMFCDTIEMADFSSFMIHNYFHGAQGGGAQVKEYVNFIDSEFSTAVRAIYKDFLSEDEMVAVSSQDKELWYNKEDVLRRWENKQLLGSTAEES